MCKIRTQREETALLALCYFSRVVIGSSQPFGVQPAALVCIAAAGTLLQMLLMAWVQKLPPPQKPAVCVLIAVFLCFAVGYDFVKADRFYRAVTSQHFVFWWLTGGMMLFGWYASFCGRKSLQRAAHPVLLAFLLSMAALAFHGEYTLQALCRKTLTQESSGSVLRLLVQYTFSGELLLWYCWHTEKPNPLPALWRILTVRLLIVGVFAVLGGMVLGERFADTPQIFGVLSLDSVGTQATYPGVLYHTVWLSALTIRVGAICCTIKELGQTGLPRLSAGCRWGFFVPIVLAASLVWSRLWQQDGTRWLAWGTVLVLTAVFAASRERKRKAL